MDGLLLDTERICWECFKKACMPYGYDPDFSIYRNCIGRSAPEGDIVLDKGFSGIIPYMKIKPEWNRIYHKSIEEKPVPLKSGAKELLSGLMSRKARMAVATSTGAALAEKKLSGSGIRHYFEFIISGESLKRSKPDPEIYIRAAGILGADPRKCLAFEDSDNGVRSAAEAGMSVIRVPDMTEPSPELIYPSYLITNSLRNIVLK